MFTTKCILFIVLLSTINAYKYLFVSTNIIYSHLVYNGKIAQVLQERGHHVDFIMIKANKFVDFNGSELKNVTTITSSNMDYVAKTMSGMKMYNDVFSDEVPIFDEAQFEPYLEVMKLYCKDLMTSELILEMIKNVKYDGIFTESQDLCGQAMSDIHQIEPLFLVSPVPIAEHTAYGAGIPFNPNVFPVLNYATVNGVHMTLLERLHNWNGYYQAIVQMKKWFESEKFFDLTPYSIKEPGRFVQDAALLIQNTNEFIDLPKVNSLKQVLIGGMGIPDGKPLNKELLSIYNTDKKGVVYFSFGSLADNTHLSQSIRNAFVAAFARFPDYEFVWKFNDDLNGNGAKNVHTMKWVDQVSILNHPKTKAFITHCGLNSLNEAAFAGVPMLAIPLFGDQTYNTAIVKHLGIGVNLNKLKLTEDTIYQALNTVLNDKNIRKNSLELKELLETLPQKPRERLVNAVEQATRFSAAYDKLTLPGAKVGDVHYFGLDILGLLFSLLVTGVFLMFLLFRMVIRIVRRVQMERRQKVE